MSTLGTFLLAVAAFVGTVLILTNPLPKLYKWARGKKKSELESEAETWIDEHDGGQLVAKGCGFLLFILLGLFYNFVVEPVAVIAALVNNIGYQPLAFAMLAIVALSWANTARAFTKGNNTEKKGVVVTEEGARIEGVVEVDEEIKLPHPLWTTTKRVFFSLPTLYLWYLFFVVIGVLQ